MRVLKAFKFISKNSSHSFTKSDDSNAKAVLMLGIQPASRLAWVGRKDSNTSLSQLTSAISLTHILWCKQARGFSHCHWNQWKDPFCQHETIKSKYFSSTSIGTEWFATQCPRTVWQQINTFQRDDCMNSPIKCTWTH